MKVAVATYGTEGDARPLAALCRSLMEAGHEALLLADMATLGAAEALGVPALALAGDIRSALTPGQGIDSAVAKGGGLGATARALAAICERNAHDWLETLLAAGEGCDVIMACGPAAFVALSAAERLGVRAVGGGLIPITPTSAFPSPFLPPGRIPRALNAASHRFVNAALWSAFRPAVNAARVRAGLAPRKRVWSDHPMLYGISPALLAPPADWPANARLLGQWLAPTRAWTPPRDLEAYLAAGEAPVYVGFGSMSGFDASALLAALAGSLRSRRVLFNPGWSGLHPSDLPTTFHVVGDTPHNWLFPQVAAVIHHGGSGTTHSAARAGAPSIVVPFAGDQPFWAARLADVGAAPAPINGRRPSADAFARALDAADSKAMREAARALGDRMRAETGVASAVAELERIVSA